MYKAKLTFSLFSFLRQGLTVTLADLELTYQGGLELRDLLASSSLVLGLKAYKKKKAKLIHKVVLPNLFGN